MSLKRNDDVLLMLGRYEDLCEEREKLPSVAQFCLTMLEKLAGGRPKAAKKFAIGKKVLNRVGTLADEKGGRAMARKAKGIDEEVHSRGRLDFSNVLSRCLFGEWLRRHNPPADCSERSP